MCFPHLKTNVVFQKGKEKKKQKEKEKEKKKKKNKSREAFALKPEHGPRGIWRKPLKPDALSLNWLGVIDLVFVIRVNR